MTDLDGPVISGISDGIFGLGFPSISRTDDKSPIDRLKDAGRIERRVFCFILNHPSNSSNIGGEIQFGGCEYKPTTNLPLTRLVYWQFNMSDVVIVGGGANKSDFHACNGCEAIMDSGTSFIGGPAKDIDQINKILGAKEDDAGNNIVDCDENHLSTLPNITSTMGDEDVILTPNEYIVKTEVSEIHLEK